MKSKNNKQSTTEDIDKICYEYFNSQKEIPINVKNNIIFICKNMNNRSHQYIILKKVVILCSTLLILITGIAFAKDIDNFIHKLFFSNSVGIKSAIENGYIDIPNLNYVESDDIQIKIDHAIMNDHNLGLDFSLKLLDVSKVQLENMIISDEDCNIF